MNRSDEPIFLEIIHELDETTELTIAHQVPKIYELLVKLARDHWLRKEKKDLWIVSDKLWKELREHLQLHARKTDPSFSSTDTYFRAKDIPDLGDVVFLAEQATQAGSTQRQQESCNSLKRLLNDPQFEASEAYKAIVLIGEILGNRSRPAVLSIKPPIWEF